ncbi:thiamine pyrophosphate-binding protein [Paracoccus sp. TK19116]|uniref:Thiamine pyrophosphate-binding protein n=1 Tax=Paracoccus albicereus TaxID=2922394 RepID=A0ABT1MRK3_9RHOB|nr:thiamine pyrophosphate-binding protein [Paracoccus albicereus]MCQ0970354.1 thiamine pyrophosphate-binding protein [Paracoccus albicereus]
MNRAVGTVTAAEKTYEILARAVRQEGDRPCFALLGDANMAWATVLADLGTPMINVRHEHCAVAAAMAYARKAGDVGLATVTCGPGLTQILTALPAAVRANLPMVIFAGEAPLGSGWYNQAIDQAPFIRAAGAEYRALHAPSRMAIEVRNAFLDARTGRRPIVLGVPMDLQTQPWSGSAELPAPSAELVPDVAPMPPATADISRAAERIAKARRIVVMAGMGAVEAGAGPACRALAERCDALLATTLPARGLFHDDPFSLGIAGGFSTDTGRALLGEADLVIAIGTILARHNADGGKLFGQADMLQIDTAPLTISQGRIAAHHHVRADARLGAEALAEAIPARTSEWRSEATARQIAKTPADATPREPESGLHDPRDVIAALDAALPDEWQMVNSSGHCSYYAAQMPKRPQEKFLTIREFGAIGNGTSFAMGVAAACPDQTIVLFDGDGSLMMHVQELETIRRHGLNILICVMNDGAYGSEIHKLRADGLSDAGAVFGRGDLAAIARGFGVGGERVKDLAALPAMVRDFAAQGRGAAAVWDFPISDRIASPVMQRAHPKGAAH